MDPSGLDSLCFDGNAVHWLNNEGGVEATYDAISGGFGSQTPEGSYKGDNLRKRTKSGMVCPGDADGWGWSLDITPDFKTERNLLRIHPDGNKPGTLGCIGIKCKDEEFLYLDLKSYFDSGNKNIQVEVKY